MQKHNPDGRRQINFTVRRTRVDFARQMHMLVDEYFLQAEAIRVDLDKLDIHKPGRLV